MELTINAETAGLIRQGIKLVSKQLKDARKKVEDLEEMHISTSSIDCQLELCGNALLLFDDQTDHVAQERTSRGETAPESQLSIDEALEGHEEEATRRVRRREVLRALTSIAVLGGEIDSPEKWSDNDIAKMLLREFDDVEYLDPDAPDPKDRKWPGKALHSTESGMPVWCAVSSEGAVPRFWYDIDPENFDLAAVAATLQGEPLFNAVREIWGVTQPSTQDSEIRRLLADVLAPDLTDKELGEIDADLEDCLNMLDHEWTMLEQTDEEGNTDLPYGYWKHTTEAGDVVLCLLQSGPTPSLHYGIDLADDPSIVDATLEGAALIDLVRDVLRTVHVYDEPQGAEQEEEAIAV